MFLHPHPPFVKIQYFNIIQNNLFSYIVESFATMWIVFLPKNELKELSLLPIS